MIRTNSIRITVDLLESQSSKRTVEISRTVIRLEMTENRSVETTVLSVTLKRKFAMATGTVRSVIGIISHSEMSASSAILEKMELLPWANQEIGFARCVKMTILHSEPNVNVALPTKTEHQELVMQTVGTDSAEVEEVQEVDQEEVLVVVEAEAEEEVSTEEVAVAADEVAEEDLMVPENLSEVSKAKLIHHKIRKLCLTRSFEFSASCCRLEFKIFN